jgi:hypothetical protein
MILSCHGAKAALVLQKVQRLRLPRMRNRRFHDYKAVDHVIEFAQA